MTEKPTRKRRRKRELLPGEPTPPRSAYNFFVKQQQELLTLYPNTAVAGGGRGGGGGGTRSLSVIGTKWRNLNETQRKHYEGLAAQDKTRYALELVRWRQEEERKVAEEDPLLHGRPNTDAHKEQEAEDDQKPKAVVTSQYGSQEEQAAGAQRLRSQGGLHGMMVSDPLQPLRIFPQGRNPMLRAAQSPFGSPNNQLGTINLPVNPRQQQALGTDTFSSWNIIHGYATFGSIEQPQAAPPQGLVLPAPAVDANPQRFHRPGSIAWLAEELGEEGVDMVIRIFR